MEGRVQSWPGLQIDGEALGRRTASFGNWAILLFLMAQGLDGVFTYVGLMIHGPGIEANPLLVWLMGEVGQGPALAGAKVTAAGLGILLHLIAVHRAVALLTALYLSLAILPWVHVLFISM